MGNGKTIISFLLGVAAGGAGAWLYLKKTRLDNCDQDILSVKESYHNREKMLVKKIEELDSVISFQRKVIESYAPPKDDLYFSDAPKNVDDASEKVDDEEPDNFDDYFVYEDDAEEDHKDGPYVISPDDFGELHGYSAISLYYYMDGIVVDDDAAIVDDVEDIVGDALEHFGEYESDVVHCRNDAKRCDYEILYVHRRYADVRKRRPPNTFAGSYVISPDDFDELYGYTAISLYYYADGVLADDNAVIIDNVEDIVGDALEHFGEYEDDAVYCRNDAKRCDYEILKDLRRYADVRKLFPPNM